VLCLCSAGVTALYVFLACSVVFANSRGDVCARPAAALAVRHYLWHRPFAPPQITSCRPLCRCPTAVTRARELLGCEAGPRVRRLGATERARVLPPHVPVSPWRAQCGCVQLVEAARGRGCCHRELSVPLHDLV
jgi:hypothetical protein